MENTNTFMEASENEKIKQQLKDLLAVEGIEKIYFVDETNEVDIDVFKGLIIKGKQDEKSQDLEKALKEHLPFQDHFDFLIENLQENWEQLDTSTQKELIVKVTNIVDPESGEDQMVSDRLESFFDDLTLLTPKEWEQQKVILAESSNRILVLFDEELGAQSRRKGHELIEEVVSKNWSSIVPVIFSFKISSFAEELTWRNDLTQDGKSNLKKENFFALSKYRKDDPNAFADGIKKALLNSYVENLKMASLAIFDKAIAVTRNEIENFDPYHFDDVVLKTSVREGVWEPFTLQRILRIIQEDSIHHEMIETDYVKRMNTVIEKAKKIGKIATQQPSNQQPYLEKLKLRYKELFLSGHIINGLNYPIENGDIFEVTKDGQTFQKYILVAQECDLMVRSNGTRNSKVAVLLQIEKIIETSGLSKTKLESLDFPTIDSFLLKYYNEGTNNIAKVIFKNAIHVDVDFLDLTVLDKTGKAKISFDIPTATALKEELSEAWKNRYDNLYSKFKILAERTVKYQEVVKKANSKIISRWIRRFLVKEDFTQQLQKAVIPPMVFPENEISNLTISKNSFEVGIVRLQRLRHPDSKYLLDKFTRYQSRNADLHDFAK